MTVSVQPQLTLVHSFNDKQHLEHCCKVLIDFYLSTLSSSDTWPPLKTVQFVELALVRQNNEAHHLGLETIPSDIDEVYGDKTKISFPELFANVDHKSVFLFEGRQGSGKTTLMLKISCDWANGEILQSKLVILVQLRQLGGRADIYINDLLQAACSNLSTEDTQFLSSHFERNCGEDVVFILDGFDEYAPGTSEQNFIYKLIMKQFFSKSVIVISSRPAATQCFRCNATKWIEVVGFLKGQVKLYIHSYFDNKEKAQWLIEHLEKHPNLINLCYLPLHCAMLVFLYEEDEKDTALPITETDFYKHFTLSTLFRLLCRKKVSY